MDGYIAKPVEFAALRNMVMGVAGQKNSVRMFRPVADGYSAPGYCESKFQGFNLSGNLNHYVQTIHLARNPSRCFLIPDVNHDGFIATAS